MWGSFGGCEKETKEGCFILCDPYAVENLGFKVLSLENSQKAATVPLFMTEPPL